MKRFWSLGLTLLMVTCLVACGEKGTNTVSEEELMTSSSEIQNEKCEPQNEMCATQNEICEPQNEKVATSENQDDNRKEECNGNLSDRTSKLVYSVPAEVEDIFNQRLNECLATADGCTRLVDKEKAIYDWIILNCKYDTSEKHPKYCYSPEGVFVYGTAVCDGYTKAMKLCMDKLGIECTRVVGYAHGEPHSWNNIKLDDGCWYELDVTWGDPVPDIEGRVSYQYFNVTTDYISRNHDSEEGINCTATKYSYWNTYANQIYVSDRSNYYSLIAGLINEGRSKASLALEYSCFRTTDNLRGYSLVHQMTGKDCYYKVEQVYEDGGTTTHFPNGTILVDVTFYYGEFDDGYIMKYISSQNEFDEIIKNSPINDSTMICFSISADNYVAGNYTRDHISKLTTKQIANTYVEKVTDSEYVIWVDLYASEECMTVTTLEGIEQVIDLNMNGNQDEFSVIYAYGENSARTDLIQNRIVNHLKENYGLPNYCVSVDFFQCIDRGYRIEIKVKRR